LYCAVPTRIKYVLRYLQLFLFLRLYNFKNINNIHNIYLHILKKFVAFRMRFRLLFDYHFIRKSFYHEKSLSHSYIASDTPSSHPCTRLSTQPLNAPTPYTGCIQVPTYLHAPRYYDNASVSRSNSFHTLRFS
jgi:hypothetical protein